MPRMELVVEFFRHNAMMNRRLVEACRQLSPEQLGATATGTYGSIGATLVHIANAQEGYAARLLDTERPVADIALETGFTDQSHLTRVFRRSLRETPAAFRRRFRHG